MPTRVINRLIDRGLSRNEVFDIIIPLRTWKHRKSRREPLSREESERVVRAARILARAQAVLGDLESALEWLRTPRTRFENRPPMHMLSTETGGRLVEQMLIQSEDRWTGRAIIQGVLVEMEGKVGNFAGWRRTEAAKGSFCGGDNGRAVADKL